MPKITVLDEITQNQIAAGEVIERPASVVKELVENSIDAGASRISVELVQGGKAMITVLDNGIGISADEIELAIERHATSKIESAEDLFNILTLGFRGEALASIVSVAKVEILSHHKDAESGTQLTCAGGHILGKQGKSFAQGTRITVQELFYNLPPRQKFLKNDAAELGHSLGILNNLALAYPEIAFSISHNGKMVMQTTGSGRLKDALVAVYNKSIIQNLLPISYTDEYITLGGLLSKPITHRPDRTMELIFVNRRPVKVPVLIKALEDAYRHTMPSGRYPMAFITMDIDPGTIDVNVHPTKKEIRFREQGKIFDALKYAIRQSLAVDNPGDYGVRSPVTNTGSTPLMPTVSYPNSQHVQTTFYDENVLNTTSMDNYAAPPYPHQQPLPREVLPRFQLRNTFIVAESPEGLVLVDQHVAHERVLYDELRLNRDTQKLRGQILLTAESLEFSKQEYEALSSHRSELQEIGYEIEAFGDGTLLLRTVPTGMENQNHHEILQNFAIEIISSGSAMPLEEIREKALIMVACKSAIKAGDPIHVEEARELLRKLLLTTNPYTCPHGRPIIRTITYPELMKMFER